MTQSKTKRNRTTERSGSSAPQIKAKIIVSAGHVHNYERFSRNGVTFLVSGGGGASPVEVERASDDLYQNRDFPNYHFVEFVQHGNIFEGMMYRLADAKAEAPTWEIRDSFQIHAK